MSEVITFEPRDFPGVSINRDTAIVTANHLGADMRGDAGLDAQYLADVSGHTVIGLNRIGSGDQAIYSRALAEQLTSNPEDITVQWHEMVQPVLRRNSPSRVQLVGRSACANLMLQVAALELIPQTIGIFAIEALRMQRINTRRGQLKYIDYQLRHEGKFKEFIEDIVDPDLASLTDERPATAANPWSMAKRQLVDIWHYQHQWATDLPYRNALHIAKNIDIAVSLLFAEDSMGADAHKMPDLLDALKHARKSSGLQHDLHAEVAPRTTHGSFDDQRLYVTRYRRFAAMTQS